MAIESVKTNIVISTFQPRIGKHSALFCQVVQRRCQYGIMLTVICKILTAPKEGSHMAGVSRDSHVPDGIEILILRTHAFRRYSIIVESDRLDAKLGLGSLHLYVGSPWRDSKRFKH